MPPSVKQNQFRQLKLTINNLPVFIHRETFTAAQVNAGVTVLPALPGYKYQFIGAHMAGTDATVTGLTTLDVLGTQSGSGAKLFTGAQASLTNTGGVGMGAAAGVVLASGASFAPCDVNTAITLGKTGGSMTGAAAVNLVILYALVKS